MIVSMNVISGRSATGKAGGNALFFEGNVASDRCASALQDIGLEIQPDSLGRKGMRKMLSALFMLPPCFVD